MPEIIPTSPDNLPLVESTWSTMERKNIGKFVRTNAGSIEFHGRERTRRKTIVDTPDGIPQAVTIHPERPAVVKGFNFDQAVEKARELGPLIEVAGPSLEYRMRPMRGKNIGKTLVSNIVTNTPAFKNVPHPVVDYLADAVHLPHPDESIGGVFVANFNPSVREETAETTMQAEFARVLKPGGIAVVQGMDLNQLDNALQSGLEPMWLQLMHAQTGHPEHPNKVIMWGILQKPEL